MNTRANRGSEMGAELGGEVGREVGGEVRPRFPAALFARGRACYRPGVASSFRPCSPGC